MDSYSFRRRSERTLRRGRRRQCRFEPLESRQLLAADLLLTEFVAAGDAVFRDEDGSAADWIEVYNPGTDVINLLDWSLTDDAGQQDKWRLPYVDIDPGSYLVVFASGKDRPRDDSLLTRDFVTTGDGTFLVDLDEGTYDVRITMGDGKRVRDLMAVSIQGEQVDTVSVEAGQFMPTTYRAEVIGAGTGQLAIRIDDTGGLTGRAAVNAIIITPAAGGEPVGQFDFGTATSPVEPGFVPVTDADTYDAASGYGWEPGGTFKGQDRPLVSSELHTNFKLSDKGEYLGLFRPDGSKAFEYAPQFPPQRPGVSYGIAQERTDTTPIEVGATARLFIPTAQNGGDTLGTSWTEVDFDDVSWTSGPTGIGYERASLFEDLIETDIEAEMFGQAATAYARIPFTLADPREIYSLNLNIQYDDGFVAYLNGVEVVRRNAPETVGWDSQAANARADSLSMLFEEIDLTASKSLLRAGENVLAIHGLNAAANSDRFLLVPELIARRGAPIEVVAPAYFSTPTPAAPNGTETLTGLLAVPTVSVDGGFFDEPFDVVVTAGTAGATLVYTTDGSTPSLTNGTQVAAADGLSAPATTVRITGTTLLRAAAFKEQLVPAPVVTRTYLFLDEIASQDYQATVDAGFPELWGTFTADYGLDPDVVGPGDLFGGQFADQLIDSLKSVPTVSIVTDLDNLFSQDKGIYVNATRSGEFWERPTSVELLLPDGSAGFQINAGLRIQGDNSRNHDNNKKHSFRIVFRQQYGAPKLDYPFFGDGATNLFDQIILRGAYNDGWSHTKSTTQFLRDQWARSTQLDMGQISSYGNFVQVYLNGFYWGLYNAVERPEASFASTYVGGDKDQWDALNTGRAVDGSIQAWVDYRNLVKEVKTPDQQASNAALERLLGNNPDGSDNTAFETFLDPENYIDYLIMNFYGGNTDWPTRNYYAARQRGPDSTGFKFFSWDAEKILDHGEGSNLYTNQTGASGGSAVFYASLRANDEFRLMFADRVQKHFFNGGALYVDPDNPNWDPEHPERNQPAARYDRLVQEAELGLLGETARWGDTVDAWDSQDAEGRLFTLNEWRVMRDSLFDNYFPKRAAIVLDQLRARGLFPDLAAPAFNQHGGEVPAGFELSMTAPGEIYYTLDGSDPRLSALGREGAGAGATVSATAIKYSGPIPLDGGVVKARTRVRVGDLNLDGQLDEADVDALALALKSPRVYEETYGIARIVAGDTDGDRDLDFDDIAGFVQRLDDPDLMPGDFRWSALNEAAFAPDELPLRVTEIMYHPADPDPGSVFANDSEFEFIELANTSATTTIDLAGMALTEGVQFTFPQRQLAPGQRIVVVRNEAAFAERYGTEIDVAGQYDMKLDNGGETIALVDARGALIQEFTYDDAWYPSTDGEGFSLEMVDPQSENLSLWDQQEGWLASLETGGTPGADRATGLLAMEERSSAPGDAGSGAALAEAVFATRLARPVPGDTDGDGDVDFDDILPRYRADRDWAALVDHLLAREPARP